MARSLTTSWVSDTIDEDAHSIRTRSSAATSLSARKRAKAEAAKARISFVEKEAEVKQRKAMLEEEASVAAARLRRRQADLEAEMMLLSEQKELAAAEAEADALSSDGPQNCIDLPEEPSAQRTANYVDQHSSSSAAGWPAQPNWSAVFLKKELLLNRVNTFDDKPEHFLQWKESFRSVVDELNLGAIEQLDFMVKWLGKESANHAKNIRAANPTNPERAVQRVWERLDERYGAPELLHSSLQDRIQKFPKLQYNADPVKLFDLADLVAELESVKADTRFSSLLSVYDTSIGINPIVSKLPPNLREKWTSRAVKFKNTHGVLFPPLSEFSRFIRETAKTKNDPSFVYETHSAAPKLHTLKTVADPSTSTPRGADFDACPLHESGKHSLAECREFRSKSIQERKRILRKNDLCYRCCEKAHLAEDCHEDISCTSCGSDEHITALHVHGGEPEQSPPHPPLQVNSKCTQICMEGASKSCAKIIPVKVSQPGKRYTKVYAIVDDQSNRSLASPSLFDSCGINGEEHEYTLTSCNGEVITSGRRAVGLVVESLDGNTRLKLPTLIECDQIPNTREEIPTPEVARHHPHLQDIERFIPPLDDTAEISLLIGRDLIEVHHVLEQRIGPRHTPYAQKLKLGWVIIGEACLGRTHPTEKVVSNKTFVLGTHRPSPITCPNTFTTKERPAHGSQVTFDKPSFGDQVFDTTEDDDKPGLSIEDRDFLNLMSDTFKKDVGGAWTAPLPFREGRPRLANNKPQAVKRANSLAASFRRDQTKKEHFLAYMQEIIDAGYAEIAPPLQENEECWYLPIFGVYHPKKPGKIRVVFDSSAKYDGLSLNDVLLTGPDMINNLLGVLLRFRQEPVAVMVDIAKMFFCFGVTETHRNFLRFLWHRHNDPSAELVEYRMTVHVFGNSPSPAVATYGLRKAVETSDPDIRDFIARNFYVDDGLISFPSSNQAIDLIKRTQTVLQSSGIRLHKIASNSMDVMQCTSPDDLASGLRDLDFSRDVVPPQRSLGMGWRIDTDSFTFQYNLDEKPFTRRGVLSVVNSVFDPIGFLSPVTIEGKIFLREVMSVGGEWDTPLPESFNSRWQQWLSSLHLLGELQVGRCYVEASHPQQQGTKELHVFSDASEKAIAAVAYIRDCSPAGVNVSFALGKAKVAPTHAVTMPRLELCAALLATEIAEFVNTNVDFSFDSQTFYSDSRVVLGYITNRTRRFYIYVANRVQKILANSKQDQWRYIRTDLNPSDLATRGVPADHLDGSPWLAGPEFLRSPSSTVESEPSVESFSIAHNDKEVRPIACTMVTQVEDSLLSRFSRFSEWSTLLRTVARLIHITSTFKGLNADDPCFDKGWHLCALSTESLEHARCLILCEVQRSSFHSEVTTVSTGIHRNSPLATLDPFLDSSGLLRVGGRLRRSSVESSQKHPVILPKACHVTTLIIRHFHQEVKHQGRHFTEGAVRSAGFWIVGGKRLVSSIIFNCVVCRKMRGKQQCQKMADLPIDRLEPGPPFTNVGVDTFGPWEVVCRRTRGGSANSKRWAILFSCLTTRAIHIEVVEELSTSSFINALRRFFAIRGVAKILRSDCGTNFVGCDNLLKDYLLKNDVKWIFNPPHSSHMGGAWERMIGVVRRILDGIILQTSTKVLTHEVLVTFMAEVTAIVNSRPLVPVSVDVENPEILSPNMLLTQKPAFEITDPLVCDDKDIFRAQWRRVQSLAGAFWKRWRSEYLATLQARRKWTRKEVNIKELDVVLMRDLEVSRGAWPLGIVNKVESSADELVRKVEVWVPSKGRTFRRPITEIVKLVAAEQ